MMNPSCSQLRDHQPNGAPSCDNPAFVARKYTYILRHSLKCRQVELSGTAEACSFPVCSQMRRLLDHIYVCDRDDCEVRHCATCKKLLHHIENCEDPRCEICPSRVPSDGSGTGRHSLGDIQNVSQYSQQCSTNGSSINASQLNSNQNVTDAASTLASSSTVLTNGYDWHSQFDAARRDEIVNNYASKVFPPATYNDSRVEAVFTLFKEHEEKLFKESLTEREYFFKLQSFIVRLQNELKLKTRTSSSTLTNGNVSPENLKDEYSSECQPKSQMPSTEEARPAEISQQEQSESSSQNLPIKSEAGTPLGSASSVDVKVEESSETTIKKESTSSNPANKDGGRRCVWTKEQLKEAFIPLLKNVSLQQPHSLHFLKPVPYEELKLLDYTSIVQCPMDLSTIEQKLEDGKYSDPWAVVDDFWLMFNNAWKYNKKNSKIYKACTKLSEIFETFVDPLMQKLGFCCGRNYVYHPHVLTCLTDKSCNINRDDVYYLYETSDKDQKKELLDKYVVCEKCYQSAGNVITIDDQTSPVHLEKSRFERQVNNSIVPEKFVNCRECGRKWHKVCACHMDEIWPSGFVCNGCRKAYGISRSPNRFTAKRLPTCKLSDFLEKRVNDFMKKNESQAGEVIVRVLASANKSVEVKKYMREIYTDGNKFPDSFAYRAKVIFAFQELDGEEVCFFGLYVQEYPSECPMPNKRRIYLAYLDSVYFFQPKQYRTDIYHEILIGYLHYAKKQGFTNAHIWACPPGEGDDYIFHMHPPDQKIPKPKRLQDWYKKMLQKAHNERIVVDYNNIYQDAVDNKILAPTTLPYFDGDLWPNTLEELLKPVVEARQRMQEEGILRADAAGDDCTENGDEEDSNQGTADFDRKPGSVGSGGIPVNGKESKKKTKKRKIKRASSTMNIPGGSKRKRLSAANSGDLEAEVQRRLEETLQRHSEAFLTINLQSRGQIENLKPITDPDPLFASELMECRDSFLSRARERHLEFSSLRRAKFSTLAFLYDIHTENKDTFIYCCKQCQKETESPRLCKQCSLCLCEECFKARGHQHSMEKVVSEDSSTPGAIQQSDRLKMERCVELLKHTSHCRDANCRTSGCKDMKRRLIHFQVQHDRNKCLHCRQIHRIIAAHANKCLDAECRVMYCMFYKAQKKQQESQQRLRKLQTLRRRQKTMQCSNNVRTPQQPTTPQSNQPTAPPSVAAPAQIASAAGSTVSPTVMNGPSSSEAAHSFPSLASPRSVSNQRNNSPSKPPSVPPTHPGAPPVAGLPATLQYSHSSPYQQHMPQPSPHSVGAPKSLSGSHHHHASPADFQQQSSSINSPYQPQQPPPYQIAQQEPQMQLSNPQPPPQMQQTRGYPPASDTGTLMRQGSSGGSSFYENGQPQPQPGGYMKVPYQQPHQHHPPGPPENEEMYNVGMPSVGVKRQYSMNEGDVIMPGGGAYCQPSKQPRMMTPQQMPPIAMPDHQHPHWSSGGGGVQMPNGQVLQGQQPSPSSMNPMNAASRIPSQMGVGGPTRPQQQPPSNLPTHLSASPSPADIDVVLSVRRKFPGDMDFNSWLQQQPQMIPVWNFIRNQHMMGAANKPAPPQYASQPMPPQQQQQGQMMRNSPVFMPSPQQQPLQFQQQQRMLPLQQQQPGQNSPMGGVPWQMQQQQQEQQMWGMRHQQPSCYLPPPPPQGKLPYNPNPQQQHIQLQQQQNAAAMAANSPYTQRYPPPGGVGVGGGSGVMLRAPPQQRMPQGCPSRPPLPHHPMSNSSPYPPPPPSQQPSLMLSQLLVQPNSQQQQQPMMQRPLQDGPPPPPNLQPP